MDYINQNFDEVYSSFVISDDVTIGNSSPNTVVSNTGLVTGNTIANAVANSINFKVSNSTVYSTLSPGSILIGNSTVNAVANSTNIKILSANVTSNTLTLGSSTDAANGYTYLPNGFKLNWGKVSANSSSGTITFTSAYSTNCYAVSPASNATGTYAAAVISQNSTSAEIRTSNDTVTDVYFTAVGK
jgi:hypothetical protein